MAFSLVPLLLLALPVAEIAVFIVVGQYIGLFPTLAMILVTAVIGSALLRIQGFGLLQRIRQETERGRVPGRELVHGVMILVAGVLLLTPGFITDTLGFLLFVPAVRDAGWRVLRDRIVVMSSSGFAARAGARDPRAAPAEPVIDLDAEDFERNPDPSSPWAGRDGRR